MDCWLARGRFPVRVTYGGQHFAARSRPRPTMQDIRHVNHKQAARAPFCGRHVCRPYAWTERGRFPKTVSRGERARQNQHPSNPFAGRYRVVCRGRIYAARQGCAARGVCGSPAVCPGLQGRGNAVVAKKREIPRGFAGRMHAAPTMQTKQQATRKHLPPVPFCGRHVLYSAITWYTA